MKREKDGKIIRGLTPHYDDQKKLIGYTARDIWGGVKYYDTELNLLDKTERNFIKIRPKN